MGGSVGSGFGGGGAGAAAGIGGAGDGPGGNNSAGPNAGTTGPGGDVGPGGGKGGKGDKGGGRDGYGSQAPGAANKSGKSTSSISEQAAKDAAAFKSAAVRDVKAKEPENTPISRDAIEAALAAVKQGPTAMDRFMSATTALVVPAGMALRSAGVLPSAEDVMQGRVEGMLSVRDNTQGDPEGGDGARTETTPTDSGQKKETDQQEEKDPFALLTRMQELGTRAYLDQLQNQNAAVAKRAAVVDPGAAVDPLDLYASFMEEGRQRNLAAIDALIGADYGRIG